MEKIFDLLSHELQALRYLVTPDQNDSDKNVPGRENTFQKSVFMLETIISNATELSFFVIDHSFSYTYFNHAHRKMAKEIWGIDIYLGGSLLDIISNEEDATEMKQYFNRAFSGESYKLVHQYGENKTAYYESTFHSISNHNGEIENVAVISMDITHYFKDQKALKASQRRYFDLIKEHRDGFALLDKRGKIVLANPSFSNMLGYSESEIIRLSEKDITLSPLNESNQEDQLTRLGYSGQNETNFCHKKGWIIPVEHRSYAVYDENHQFEGTWAHVRDITRKKKRIKEEFIRRHKAKAVEFLSENIAKKVNHSINSIINHSRMIKEWTDEKTPLIAIADEITLETQQITQWVNGLLQFIKSDENQLKYSKIPHIAHHAATLANMIMSEKVIEITSDMAEHLPHIKCYEQHIQQVLIHLIFLMAERPGSSNCERDNQKIIQLKSYIMKESDRGWLRTSVIDRDLQFSPSQLEQITESFYQKEWQREEDFKYLAACHHIINDHGGRLHMESVSDVYSQFHTDLPLNKEGAFEGYS